MAQVIEFYIPARFHKRVKWVHVLVFQAKVPLHQRGVPAQPFFEPPGYFNDIHGPSGSQQ